jgi:CelD/BcsL family acetyltransferase involved in cellulose biosynthesis
MEDRVSLRARLASVADLEPAQVFAWRDLVRRAAEPNPFYEPAYLEATVRYRRTPVTLVTVSDGADMVACLPLYGHERMSRFRLPAWGMDPAYAEAGLRTAIEFLSTRWGPRRILRLHRVPVDGTVGPALLAAVKETRCSSLEAEPSICPFVKRRPNPTYLDETLKGRTRRKLGQKRRNFERALGDRLRIVDRGSEPQAVERFLALEAAGWKGLARTAMLSTAGEGDFFRAVCSAFAADNRLRLLSLEAGSVTVAMRCDVLTGERLFSLKMTYDERFAQFSPGLLLEVDSVQVFHESAATWLYSATNYPDSPAFFVYPDRQVLVHPVVIPGRLARRLVERVVLPTLRTLRRGATVDRGAPGKDRSHDSPTGNGGSSPGP